MVKVKNKNNNSSNFFGLWLMAADKKVEKGPIRALKMQNVVKIANKIRLEARNS